MQNSKIKVLQINTVCGKGSTGNISVNINKNLIKNGHEGIVAYGYGSTNYEYSYKIGGSANYYYHNMMSRVFGHEGFYSVIVTIKFIKWIKNYNPDIIHLHNLHGHYINIKLLFIYLKKSKKPVVWTLHDCWPFTGKCTHFVMIDCQKWKNRCYNCPQLNEYPPSLFDTSKKDYLQKKNLFTGLKIHIVTPSNWLKELVKCSFLKSNDIQIINNGIDIEIFSKKELLDDILLKLLEEKFVVLGVAAPWTERKGYNDFLKIAEILKKNESIKIVMIGLSPEQMKELPENIIGIKKTENARILASIYSRADVFLNTTYEDNYPTVNLESLACQTPVITYDTGGSSEAVEKYNAGCVVEKGDYIKAAYIINDFVTQGAPPVLLDLNRLSSIISDDVYMEKYIDLVKTKLF